MKKIVSSFITILLLLSLNACDDKKIHTAKVIDSTVEGIEYQCAGLVKYTTKSGVISCYHLPLGFKVGEIKIGILYSIPSDGIIFPQDMLNVRRDKITDDNVKKLTTLLQTVDSDNNPENGITISKETREKLDDFISLKDISYEELVDYLEAKLGKKAVKEKEAINHLYHSMKKLNAEPRNFDINSYLNSMSD